MKEKPTITFRLGDDFYKKLREFTDKFIADGYELFSDELKNIDQFIEFASKDSPDRSDRSFRQNPKVKYLLEAVYFQIMDDINREAFNKTKDTVIILPDCMSLLMDKCKREKTEYGKVCTHCVPKCDINKIMEFAEKYNVEGYFSKRQLEEQLENIKKKKPDLSVIGIACLLTLASGMRTASNAGVPSRGVFLNFTGCDHWADKPFPTETVIEKIESILEEKYGLRDSSS